MYEHTLYKAFRPSHIYIYVYLSLLQRGAFGLFQVFFSDAWGFKVVVLGRTWDPTDFISKASKHSKPGMLELDLTRTCIYSSLFDLFDYFQWLLRVQAGSLGYSLGRHRFYFSKAPKDSKAGMLELDMNS